jgi:hypothetical protein
MWRQRTCICFKLSLFFSSVEDILRLLAMDDGGTKPSLPTRLSSELHQLIFAFVEDELSVLRLGSTCTVLASVARSAPLWQRFLTRFFDGELPPALMDVKEPLNELRDQVRCARALMDVERAQRRFQVLDVTFPSYNEWRRALDERVAAAQHTRSGRPNYGCSGGAYVQQTLVFGSYVKSMVTNSTASALGIEPARLVAWGSMRGALSGGCQEGEVCTGYDYGSLCDWKEAKLIELACLAGHASLVKSLTLDHARGGQKSEMSTADVSVDDKAKRQPDPLRIGLPRLLAGMYGGLFLLSETGTSIGVIHGLECVVDGTSISDFSDM